MIDLHSHILPGMDDGSRSVEESLAMLRIAADAGTTDIVATPHASFEYDFDPELASRRIEELRSLRAAGPRIHRGCDCHLTLPNIENAIAAPERYTIGGRGYLLVEFSDFVIFPNTGEIFRQMKRAGIVPVITHPERNQLLQRRIGELDAWVKDGCALQLTAQSFLGRFGKEARDFCRELMGRRLVHFVASDAHDCVDRPPRLDEAFAHVAAKYGEPRATRLFVDNPRAALEGRALDPEPPQPRRRWFDFRRPS